MAKKILITGGAGYIGSHTALELLNEGYEVVVYDNLCNSSKESLKRVEELTGKHITFYEGDVMDEAALKEMFEKENVDAVIHCAALKAVGESVQKPLEYYRNNITGTLTLMDVMKQTGVKNIVFSSSATVYGSPEEMPITEECPKGQCTNPYGWTKSMLEQNKIRKAELNQKILANKTQYSSAEEEMKREEELLKAAKKELDSAYVAKKELLRNADIKRQDILSLQKKQQEKQKNYHIIDSKLETVKNMAERYEGYSQSIRRVMEQKKPPIRMIAPGRVFRADEVDATHSPSFHQIEGMVIDKGITFSNLKGTLTQFVQKLFGKETKVKFRPHHFPFTEPSAEMDVSCFKCGGKGCRFCKGEGWIEILGCGMVHPRVLRMSGIDPEEYSGFAFGIGLERITLLKYEIDDMRLLYENDDRFLKQF